MTTILTIFIISLVLSLVLTPFAGWLGERFGAMDMPGERKIHSSPIPRCGGLAIFVAFFITLALSALITTGVSDKLILDRENTFFLLGALLVFGVGLFDDFHRLGPKVKFLFQVIGASVAFWGGLRIEFFSVFSIDLHFVILSYFVTVFWFVFFINAINLIDGLDGLAAGITFFASAVLVILSAIKGEYLIAMLFAALAGAVLGFLRYNFNPANIFMGDGGSYFLGYAIAGLSIMGSIKNQVGAAMLIPIVALGVPIFDTILSPIRRFITGRKMFYPDNGHFHHRLKEMGFSTKKVVWIIYKISFCLCVLSVALVNVRDERAGMFLILIGASVVIFIRKLGYLEYVTSDKIYGWFKDITDDAGFRYDRRNFLNLQIQMGKSGNLEEVWQNLCTAAEKLEFDMAELHLCRRREDNVYDGPRDVTPRIQKKERRKKRNGGSFQWTRKGFDINKHICGNALLKLELPLISGNGHQCMGILWMIKDIKRNNISHYTLRRVEHLRRTVNSTLGNLGDGVSL
ncbi:MAG: undecaprenyl/decaprenyl-phosphate alpha-N-acetylglucosaminyl 1-phosphate transferase [Deltaproteobacteria bacterium]|nr:MAG: undecaprenyl/decaprenyl-phosphate alpha-N-acetylglucosaminyl 1-phosphate transferase [Deltaproteobacteria bacterium]